MKYLSVCSGIEAATVAWHGFGWTPVAFAEVEAFPAAVLAHHYPTVPNLGDLTRYREWPEELLVEVDLLVGGTPCQAFSVAGLRRSLDDERGNLSLTYVNLYHHINEVRKRHGRSPAIALWENVPGVLSTKDNAFGCFIGGLLGCDEAPETESGKWDKAGFLSSETVRVGYRVLDAQYFGVAQRRRRVFLVAVPCELVERFGERACPSEILSLRESVLGNPPTRGASWEGAARAAQGGPASGGGCGEPFYLDRASDQANAERLVDHAGTLNCNKGQRGGWIAGHEPPVIFTGDGVTADPISAHEARTYTHEGLNFRLHNCVGRSVCATGDKSHALTTRSAVEEDGTGRGTPIVPVAGEPQTFDWQASDGGNDTSFRGASRAYVVDKPGCSRALTSCKTLAVATPIDMRQASRGEKVTNNRLEGSGGPPGHGVGDAGDQAFTVSERGQAVAIDLQNVAIGGDIADTLDTTRPSRGGGQAVAFKPGQSEAAGGTFVTEEFAPTVQGQNNGSTAVPAVAFTKAKRAQSNADDETWVPGSVAPTQNQFDSGDTRATTVVVKECAASIGQRMRGQDDACADNLQVVAFTQNSRDEVRLINEDGNLAGALSAEGGMHQTNCLAFSPLQGGRSMPVTPESPTLEAGTGNKTPAIAFANRTRDGIKVPEVMKDGVVPALTNPGGGGRSDAVNVASAMQVRRLTPTECAYLQGFPSDYLDITFRKKPAADGPKYRALGNSMAVPCMWWLGLRIQKATSHD